jgi:hypothetical protein
LGLPSSLHRLGFPTKTLYARLLFHICYTFCPSQPSWFDHPNNHEDLSKFIISLLKSHYSAGWSLVSQHSVPPPEKKKNKRKVKTSAFARRNET